jgi:hypothetical protein
MTNVRLANVLSVGSGRTLLLAGIASACLIGPGTASAISVYDFGQQAIDDGEQGYTNSPTPYSSTSNGLTLTATAYENGLDSHVYLDGPFGGRRGGMGVCSILNGTQCDPSSDDNVSIDDGNEEVLQWDFSAPVYGMTLTLRDTDHYDFDGALDGGRVDSGQLRVSLGGGLFETVSVDIVGSNILTLIFDGPETQIQFKALNGGTGDNKDNHFYIETAEIATSPSEIPVPAAVWLFASGLLGMVGVARRKKA